MKLKYYLRGLGLGIIFTSIILAIAYSQNKGLTSDSEIMKRASELGMVSTESESNDLFEQEGTESAGTETEGEGSVTQPEQTTQPQDTQIIQSEGASQQPEVQTSQQAENTQQVSQVDDSQQTADEPEYIVIEVVPGEVCRQIAEDLKAHGLVDDAETFRKYMEQENYDNSIRVGKFPIKKGASFEEIAITLTTKQ